jgi:hypothetical protein
MATPNITDWISAISTAALGVIGAIITLWQWMMTRFRPKFSSRIDAQREAIELWIVNKGRASGIIDRVQILRPDKKIEGRAQFESFPGNSYRPLSLPAMASMRIIIQAPPAATFDPGVQVLVGVGQAEPELITPIEMTSELGLYGLKSVLPPGTSRLLQREVQELGQLPSAERLTGQLPGYESAGSTEHPTDSQGRESGAS